MIKQADEVKYVGDLAANVSVRLALSKEAIINSTKVYEERDVHSIYTAVTQILNRVDGFMEAKRKNTLKETMIA